MLKQLGVDALAAALYGAAKGGRFTFCLTRAVNVGKTLKGH